MSVDEFLFLNPQHNRPVIAGADEYTILLPIDKAELFAAKLELTDQPLVSWQAYRMRNGETLAQVAAKFGMSVETLRAVNGIGARTKPPAGHTLLVPSQRRAEQRGSDVCRKQCSRPCRRAARSTTRSSAATRSRSIAARYEVTWPTSGAGTVWRRPPSTRARRCGSRAIWRPTRPGRSARRGASRPLR